MPGGSSSTDALDLAVDDNRGTSGLHAGTSYSTDDRTPLVHRATSWVLVPPEWAELTLGCDFCTLQNAPRFILLVFLLAVLIFASETLTPGKVEALLEWLHEEPLRGSISFVALLIAAHLIAFPSVVLSLAAGAVFGVVLGSFLVWLGISLGQILAFFVGRYMLKGWVSQVMVHYFPKWAAVDSAISKEGWKLVALLRLSPIIPWNVLNFALSVTGLSFPSFAIPSTLAIIPWSTTTVYFGSLARDLAGVVDGKLPFQGTASYVFYGLSGILMVLSVTYMTVVSRRAIKKALVTESIGRHAIVEELDALEQLGASPRVTEDADDSSRSLLAGGWPWQGPAGHPAAARPNLRPATRLSAPHEVSMVDMEQTAVSRFLGSSSTPPSPFLSRSL